MSEPFGKTVFYTKDEYLEMEASADRKSEYYQGEIFAMTGGSLKHSVICLNLYKSIWDATSEKKNCTAFESNMKLEIGAAEAYVYPDAMVVCGDVIMAENSTDTITNPVLIIEVLSPSTESFDRGKKFEYYRSISTLKEYIMVSQDRPKVETYFRQNENVWQYIVLEDIGKTLVFQTLEHEVSMAELYFKIDLL